MRADALLREVARNLVSGTARAVPLALMLAVALGGLVAVDLFAVRQLVDDSRRFQAAGASVLTVRLLDGIDGRACERLRSLPAVQAAGAVSDSEEPIRAVNLPGSPIPAFAASPGFAELLLGSVPAGAGVVVSDDTARTLGVGPGDRVVAESGPTRVAGVYQYPDDGRRPGFGYGALVVTGEAAIFDECWVRAWPRIDVLPALLLTTVVPGKAGLDDPPAVAQLNTRLGETFDGAQRFAARVTAWTPLAGALAAGLFAAVAGRLRRLESAAALHVGVPRSAIVLASTLEAAAWAGAAALIGAAATVMFASGFEPPDRAVMLLLAARVVLCGWLGALAAAALTAAATRERDLFRLFKDR